MKIGRREKGIIWAFLDRLSVPGDKLQSTGETLEAAWNGGSAIALWDADNKIVFTESSSKSVEVVQEAVRREARKRDMEYLF